jgi:hypothetical protein
VSKLVGPLVCGWCDRAFEDGDDIMLDVYQHDAATEANAHIYMNGEQVRFRKTSLTMVHTHDCLGEMCGRSVADIVSRVQYPRRLHTYSHNIDHIFRHFKDLVRWVYWHYQFVWDDEDGKKDHVAVTLGSRREQMTRGTCPSFLLEISKGRELDSVKAPLSLFTPELIETLFTRIYVWDAVYQGPLNPLVQLQKTFTETPLPVRVHAFAHLVQTQNYSGENVSVTQLKIIIWSRPTSDQLEDLCRIFDTSDEVSWSDVYQALRFWRGEADEVVGALSGESSRHILHDSADQFSDCELAVQHMLESVEVRVKTEEITYVQPSGVFVEEDNIMCVSNAYQPCKHEEKLYFFGGQMQDKQQPLFCYRGRLQGPIPMLFSQPRILAAEASDAGLVEVPLPSLTRLLPSVTLTSS